MSATEVITASGMATADGVASPRTGLGLIPKAIFMMEEKTLETVYGPEERSDLSKILNMNPVVLSRTNGDFDRSLLTDVEVIMASWGSRKLDEEFLEAAPRLRAVFYAAGSIRGIITPAFWRRGISISSAYAVNALPVSEFALGAILLSLKRFWSFTQTVKKGTDPWEDHNRIVPGVYRSTIGLISCGMIARRLIQLLKPFEVNILAYDPYLTEDEAAALGIELCSLARLFKESDVVSVHTPYLPETRGLITGKLVASMRTGATLINTSRGGLIREDEMVEVLATRLDLTAILDVCDPEPPLPDTPWIKLPNIYLTPHIAGSLGPECRRLGRCMTDELARYLAGEPLQWQITEETASRMA